MRSIEVEVDDVLIVVDVDVDVDVDVVDHQVFQLRGGRMRASQGVKNAGAKMCCSPTEGQLMR